LCEWVANRVELDENNERERERERERSIEK